MEAAVAREASPAPDRAPSRSLRPKGTLLYDAVYLASNEKLQKETGRKALVLLTDGGDQGSDETLANADRGRPTFRGHRLRDHDRRPRLRPHVLRLREQGAMRKLAEQTGGRVIDVGNDPKKLRDAFDQIGTELRSQYMIGYIPTNTVMPTENIARWN